MMSAKPRPLEKGQAGLEFVIVLPVLLMALFLVTIIGNQLYQKLSAQAFVYSQCMWDVNDTSLYASNQAAFSTTVDVTKKTWSTEGAWEDWASFPETRIDVIDKDFYVHKKCTSSVTYDEWNRVGFGHFFSYNPDVLVESTMTVTKPAFANTEPLEGLLSFYIWDK